jgi:hypothetical protein
MEAISIVIQSKKDAEKGPAFPNLSEGVIKIYDLPVQKVSILEGGMKSGKTSLALCSKSEDGTLICFQLSADQLEFIAGAVRGANARFEDEKNG